MKKAIKIIAIVAVLAIIGVVLFACVPNSLDKAKSKMEKAGYKAEIYKYDESEMDAEDEDAGIVGELSAYKDKGEDAEVLYATLFKSSSKAKDYYNKYKDETDEMPDGFTYEVKGKWILVGTKAAVKAFKK